MVPASRRIQSGMSPLANSSTTNPSGRTLRPVSSAVRRVNSRVSRSLVSSVDHHAAAAGDNVGAVSSGHNGSRGPAAKARISAAVSFMSSLCVSSTL
jgi:hypothetical protein